jgi:hypothetical protein
MDTEPKQVDGCRATPSPLQKRSTTRYIVARRFTRATDRLIGFGGRTHSMSALRTLSGWEEGFIGRLRMVSTRDHYYF